MNENYLWDRSDEPDPELKQLEDALAPLRLTAKQPDFAALQHSASMGRLRAMLRPDFGTVLALAAMIAIAVLLGTDFRPAAAKWEVQATSGEPQLGNQVLKQGRLSRGLWLTTVKNSTAQIRSEKIGAVDVASDSLISLSESKADQQLLFLRYGGIHARVFSPPGIFMVETPSARAIDLGCEYTLKIDRDGRGELTVTSGWVSLNGELQSLVPAGAVARIAPGRLLSPPFFADSTPAFQQAVVDFAFLPAESPLRSAALQSILHDARQRDALTLLNLFSRANENERLDIFDRLNTLVPAPAGITRETARNWQTSSMDAWWPPVQQALGLGEIKKSKMAPEK